MGDPAARPKPAISRAEWGLLLLLAAVQFTNVLDFVIVMPLAPMAKRDFRITSEQFGHIVAAYGLASFFGSILAAKFLDRFGRKAALDRKSTRLNSSHGYISYAVFCLKKKKILQRYHCP